MIEASSPKLMSLSVGGKITQMTKAMFQVLVEGVGFPMLNGRD
jgi:hypothetical protein